MFITWMSLHWCRWTVILTNEEDDAAIIYNEREKRVDRARISDEIDWFSAIDYVESLVPTPWEVSYLLPSFTIV